MNQVSLPQEILGSGHSKERPMSKRSPTMSNVKLTDAQIIARGEAEGFTAYQIAQLINTKLISAGCEPIRPQMMYNYDRNGLIVKGSKDRVASGERYTTEEVMAFVNKFTTKRIANPKYKIQASVKQSIQTITEPHMFEKSELIQI
jgi:hypothetical protein